MLSHQELKTWLQRELSVRDKLLLLLATFDVPAEIRQMKQLAAKAGFRIKDKINPSTELGRARGLAVRLPEGWEITDAGRQRLRNLGVTKVSPSAIQVASDLRVELAKIKNTDTRTFLDEAIRCHELELYRSAIVMSWLAAVHVLYQHVIGSSLAAFNAEATRVDTKWKKAVNSDDLARMKESAFLDRLSSLSIIGSNVKKELIGCLDRRNACGHPSSLKVSANTSAHHLEVLLLNVFRAF